MLLQELDIRQRDIRYAEVMVMTTCLQLFSEDLITVLMAGFNLKRKGGEFRFSAERLGRLTEIYRDKLFHYGYLPEYERRLAEILHGKPAELQQEMQEKLEAIRKVEAMSGDD